MSEPVRTTLSGEADVVMRQLIDAARHTMATAPGPQQLGAVKVAALVNRLARVAGHPSFRKLDKSQPHPAAHDGQYVYGPGAIDDAPIWAVPFHPRIGADDYYPLRCDMTGARIACVTETLVLVVDHDEDDEVYDEDDEDDDTGPWDDEDDEDEDY